jgi:hypothetical protein
MDALGHIFDLSTALQASVFGFAALGLPIAYVWMLVDSLLRDEADYPGTESARKVLWVLGILFFHPVAVVYFFVVFAPKRRGVSAGTGYVAADSTA